MTHHEHNDRKHRGEHARGPERNAERAAFIGGITGAVLGSRGGPIGAGIGAAVGGSTGYAIGSVLDAYGDVTEEFEGYDTTLNDFIEHQDDAGHSDEDPVRINIDSADENSGDTDEDGAMEASNEDSG